MANGKKRGSKILTEGPLDLTFLGGRTPTVDIEGRMITGRYKDLDIPSPANVNKFESYKKGGKVKKTGLAKVHKGERVLTVKQAKAHAKTAPKRAAPRRRSPR